MLDLAVAGAPGTPRPGGRRLCVLPRRPAGACCRDGPEVQFPVPRACAREAETIAPAHSSRTAATGPDYGSAGRPPHIFGVPGPPAPILAPVSLMSEKSKRNLVKPRSRPFRSGWSPPSAGLSGSRGFSRAAIRACRRLRPEVGREAVRNEWAGAMVSASRAHARVGREIGPLWPSARRRSQWELRTAVDEILDQRSN